MLAALRQLLCTPGPVSRTAYTPRLTTAQLSSACDHAARLVIYGEQPRSECNVCGHLTVSTPCSRSASTYRVVCSTEPEGTGCLLSNAGDLVLCEDSCRHALVLIVKVAHPRYGTSLVVVLVGERVGQNLHVCCPVDSYAGGQQIGDARGSAMATEVSSQRNTPITHVASGQPSALREVTNGS